MTIMWLVKTCVWGVFDCRVLRRNKKQAYEVCACACRPASILWSEKKTTTWSHNRGVNMQWRVLHVY